MFKNVSLRPDWIKAESVVDIFSVSNCISTNFDYIQFWKHNGYWFFNSLEVLRTLIEDQSLDISGKTLFYYEVFEQEYNEETKEWATFEPESAFPTAVDPPRAKSLEGYDVTSFSVHTSPECSPLSCCDLATELTVNEHCLFRTFEEAKGALEGGKFAQTEPGPFRIFAVYRVSLEV
jgi:hypothetical protein